MKTKVLVVDDHQMVIEGVKSILTDMPEFEVVGAAFDGHEAIKLSRILSPDIIILDVSMPNLNGLDATLQIKKLYPKIKIIIFTMFSSREYVIDLFMAGISAYVLKNDPPSDLVLALRAVRGGGTYFSTMAPSILLKHMKELEAGKAQKHDFESLSLREREVFQLLAEGKHIKKVADILCISPKTVESHKYNIMGKLDIKSLADLIKIAIRKKIIQV